MNERRMILCLGPHRSGTSTAAAAVAALGADLGMGEVYANDENQKGFFEHPELIALNEQILELLDGAWDAPAFEGAKSVAQAGARLDPLRAAARRFLDDTFPAAGTAVLKDPRLCVLLEFWVPLLQQAGFVRIDCVHVLRDPLQAAASQQRRAARRPAYYDFGRDLTEGAALWLSYCAQMWDRFDACGHYLLSYDALIDQPETTLQQLAGFVGGDGQSRAAKTFAARFVDPALRHGVGDAADIAASDADLAQARRVFDGLAGFAQTEITDAGLLRFVQDEYAAARPRLIAVQSSAMARLANRQRRTQADLGRVSDQLAQAETATAMVRKDNAKAVRALKGETAKQKTAYLAEISQRESELSAYAAEVAKMQTTIDQLVARHDAEFFEMETGSGPRRMRAAELVEWITSLETQLAGVQAQAVHDKLVFDRDLDQSRQAEASVQAKLAAVLQSRSWKLTAPVRAAGGIARLMGRKAGGLWVRFNHFAKRCYRGIDRHSPQVAEVLRRAIVPLIRAGNRAILHSDYVPTVPSHAGYAEGQSTFQFDFQRPQVIAAYQPLVTVLVPNYNHAPYLRQRLDSIFAQTWQNYEVILMDDCSGDDSRAILQDYADRYPDRARVLFNDQNSGGAFYQWEKGLRAARGDLIWVAESDDWCSPNFLETLVPFFANQAVQLAYAPTHFMNKDGTAQVWSMAEYLSDLGPDRWTRPFVLTAPQIVREAFAEKNIIPNVSSAVFRRLDRLEVLENDIWRGMRTCGDWVFYLNQIRGGLIAYSPDAQNYYRLHPTNTSVGSYSKDSYYIEHETVARTVQRHYSVDDKVFQRQHQNLILHWTRNRPSFVRAEFDACYSLGRIMAEAAKRKPKLLMAGYAFCSGGGETFPITLANVMKTAGYDITYLNCMQEPDIAGIRSQLARDIPVVTNFEDLNGILRDFDIDVIHSHHAWVDNTVLDILPENSPVKTVITLHGMYETLPEEQLKRTLPRLVKRTGAMVYIAEKNISALVSRGLARAADLPRIDNALAMGPVTAVDRASLGIAQDAFVLTVVSRAIAPKGWQESIEAVSRARDLSGKDVHLILVGDGPEYDRLLGHVPPFVHLAGFRSNTRDYFAAADVGLLASRFKGESFPLVIIDCLHAGRPVISSDLGEIPYMLTTPDGVAGAMFSLTDWQVPVETLALQISDLARNPALLAAMTARVPEAAKRFDPVLMRDRYDRVYESVVKPRITQEAAE